MPEIQVIADLIRGSHLVIDSADARTRSTRVTDTCVWVEASALHCEAEPAR